MSNNTYDILKEIAGVWLPALATLVVAVFSLWGLPYSEPISGTIMAIDAFMGAVLKVSSKNYNAGDDEEEEIENE